MMPYSPDKYYYSLKKIEDRYAKAVRGAHANALRQVYSYLDKQKEALSPTDLGYILSVFSSVRTNLRPLIGTYTYASFSLGNQRVANLFHFGEAIPYQKGAYRSIMERNYKWVEKYGADREDALKQTLAESLESDYSMPKLKQQIKQQMNVTSFRAETIARSETQKTFSQSSRLAIANSGVTREYQWETSHLESVCIFGGLTKIMTDKGHKNIRDIKEGDMVLTHKDRYRKVLATSKRKYTGKLYKFWLNVGNHTLNNNAARISVTQGHPLRIQRDGKEIWENAENIKMTDKVMFYARLCPICHEKMPAGKQICSSSCQMKKAHKTIWGTNGKVNREKQIKRNKDLGLVQKMISEKKRLWKEDKDFIKKRTIQNGIVARESFEDPERRAANVEHCKKLAARPNHGFKNKEFQGRCLEMAHKSRRKRTWIEKKMAWWLKENGIKFEEQFYINSHGQRYYVDFFVKQANLIIECDGEYWHQDKGCDVRRQKDIENLGYNMIRFGEDSINNRFGTDCAPTLLQHINNGCFVPVEIGEIAEYVLPKKSRNKIVYNLQVEEDESFVANWIVSHNCPICRPLDGRTYSIDDKNSPMPVSHTHPNCLISHFEKVFTSKGWEQIGKIKIGDLVLTKEGKFRKVLQTFKDTDYREVVEITIQDSTLKITGEHPIMTDKGYVPANQIAINDKIMVKTKKCKECEELLFDHPYSVSDFCNGECRHRYIGKVTWKNHRKAIMAGINSENNIQTKRKMFLENNPAQSDEARKKISEYKTKHNPMHHKEYRDAMAATQIKRLSDPEVREKMSESAIKFHKDNPGHMKGKLQKAREGDPERYRQQRKKQGESLKKFYQKHPEKHPNRIMGRQGRVSAPQKELFQTIKNIYSEAKLEFPIKTKESCRFGDIVLPNKKICIEHDGKYWHQDTAEQDLKRDRELAQVGYTTIRVNEDDSHTALSQILAVLANHNSEYEFMFIPAQNVKKYTPKRRLSLYNIEVEEFNNYIAKGLVTHNCNCRIRPYWDDTDVDLEEEKQFIKDFWEAEEK